MYKVNEIFFSVQGEGPSVGSLAVFVRFSGCNLSCDFCDTDHEKTTEMTLEQVVRRIDDIRNMQCSTPRFLRSWSRLKCVFTGGEPLLQLDNELVEAVIELGLCPCVETNGTVESRENPKLLDALELCDEVVISPKMPKISMDVLNYGTCLKVLVSSKNKVFESEAIHSKISYFVDELGKRKRRHRPREKDLILQPITPKEGAQSKEFFVNCRDAMYLASMWRYKYGENWRVIPQTHKITGLR